MADTLVIRDGTIVDGTGAASYEADVAIRDGKIAAIGCAMPKGQQEIDARGKLVTPGFVDIHTHYDAQVMWSNQVSPSSWNGVTTVLIGNCGVGFAPCRPDRRDMLVKLMEGVEDIPEVVLTEGLPWNWQSFPNFLDALDTRQFDLDVGTQVPHAAVRVHVMGERGAAREPATAEDRAAMAQIAAEGVRAGALGFSTSRTIAHRTLAGEHIPTLHAAEAELATIGQALGEAGTGWMQVISDFDDPETEFDILRRVMECSGRPMTFSLLQRESRPTLWRELLDKVADVNRGGHTMKAQVISRPIGFMLGWEVSQNPFSTRPAWLEIRHLPFSAKLERLGDPAFRARLISEETADPASRSRLNTWDRLFPLNDPPDYEPPPEPSIAAEAARLGRDPAALAYDRLMEKDGRAMLYRPIINYVDGILDTVKLMLEDPNTLIGLGDGGAHLRHHLRRQFHDHDADPLGARPDAWRPVAVALRGEAADPRQRRRHWPSRPRPDQGRLQGGHQCHRLRPAERSRAGSAVRPAQWRAPDGAADGRVRGDNRLGHPSLSKWPGNRSTSWPARARCETAALGGSRGLMRVMVAVASKPTVVLTTSMTA